MNDAQGDGNEKEQENHATDITLEPSMSNKLS
jgi:hypothetical protein